MDATKLCEGRKLILHLEIAYTYICIYVYMMTVAVAKNKVNSNWALCVVVKTGYHVMGLNNGLTLRLPYSKAYKETTGRVSSRQLLPTPLSMSANDWQCHCYKFCFLLLYSTGCVTNWISTAFTSGGVGHRHMWSPTWPWTWTKDTEQRIKCCPFGANSMRGKKNRSQQP